MCVYLYFTGYFQTGTLLLQTISRHILLIGVVMSWSRGDNYADGKPPQPTLHFYQLLEYEIESKLSWRWAWAKVGPEPTTFHFPDECFTAELYPCAYTIQCHVKVIHGSDVTHATHVFMYSIMYTTMCCWSYKLLSTCVYSHYVHILVSSYTKPYTFVSY